MIDRRALETYALNNGLSFKAAKRKTRRSRGRNRDTVIARGAPVPGIHKVGKRK